MKKPDIKERKTVTLNLRVTPRTKEALVRIGSLENRSLVNTLEWLVFEYHRRNKIPMTGSASED